MIQGKVQQIISEDEEVVFNYNDPEKQIQFSRVVMLTHEATYVRIIHREALVKLHRLGGNLLIIVSLITILITQIPAISPNEFHIEN